MTMCDKCPKGGKKKGSEYEGCKNCPKQDKKG